jgi:hypothetical protein
MSYKASLNAEEWAAVSEAPLLAGVRVATAERGGSLLESFSIGQVYKAARDLRGESALLDELVADTPSIDLDRMRGAAGTSSERLRAALAILAAKATPEDLDAYKGFVLAVVQTVAEANREGGFIGLGGEEVSAREQAALDEIYALLGASAS